MAITISGNGITEDELAISNTVTALADSAATLTAAQLIGELFTITPTAPRILTTDTAVNIVAAIPNTADGVSFEFTVVNLAGFDVTFAGGTGVTIYGKTIIANGSATFRVVRLSATTVGLYRAEGSNHYSASRRDRTTTQLIANATWTIIAFATQIQDTLGELDATGRFTASTSGTYHVSTSMLWVNRAIPASTQTYLQLYKNGASQGYLDLNENSGQTAPQILGGSIDVNIATGDYIEIRCYHNYGESVNIGGSDTFLSVHRII